MTASPDNFSGQGVSAVCYAAREFLNPVKCQNLRTVDSDNTVVNYWSGLLCPLVSVSNMDFVSIYYDNFFARVSTECLFLLTSPSHS